MTRIPALSRPPEWRQEGLKGWYTTVMIVVLLGVLGSALLITVLRRNVLAAAVLGVLIAVLLPIFKNSRPHRPTGAPGLTRINSGDDDVAALRFPIPALSTLLGLSLLLLGVALTALGLAALVITIVDREWPMIIGFLMLCGLGALFLAGGIGHFRQARHELGIYLTRDHLVASTEGGRLALPWEEITEIRPFTIRYGVSIFPRPVQHWIAVAVRDRSAVPALRKKPGTAMARVTSVISRDVATALPVRRVDTDPLVLLHSLRHYLSHPADRGELGEPASLRRVESRRL